METTMAAKTAENAPAPLALTRFYPVPRETVFRAWSTAEHVSRWFAPDGFTVPRAVVEMRPEGRFDITFRSPTGEESLIRGRFVTVEPPSLLTLDLTVEDAAGHALFRAMTEARFTEENAGTRLHVTQTYTLLDSQVGWMVKGAPEGWRQTLSKLATELNRMGRARSVIHGSFRLDRIFDSPVERVYAAFSDPEAKSKWFQGREGEWTLMERRMDFREGGKERLQGRWSSGMVSTFDATYHDIVPGRRLVYSYQMFIDEMKISVSLATVEMKESSPGHTAISITEHGAFLDGYDDAGSREKGTAILLDRVGASLLC
jgi:uncharacterized protein YndB with AHSA1/START domain